MKRSASVWIIGVVLATGLAIKAHGNGGPFRIQYPEGDPAAKGVLARIGEDLKPTTEDRLRVVHEDLDMAFKPVGAGTPLVTVSAAYTIENPTDKEITVDFGFPILRGIYVRPISMIDLGGPAVHVSLDETRVDSKLITNSLIYGVIRKRARDVIDAAVTADKELAPLVGQVRSGGKAGQEARTALIVYLTGKLKWHERDAQLMAEYASIDLGKRLPAAMPFAVNWIYTAGPDDPAHRNMGILATIGEQKATQFLAHLAGCWDKKAAADYEQIFNAWGGEIKEQAVDLKTGKIRPREVRVDDGKERLSDTATIYTRIVYEDRNVTLTEEQKASCQNVLKNLPVVFTFAPMNLLYYQVKFAPKKTVVLTVSYEQYAYVDTVEPQSHQISYVVHPASMWKDFGPINVRIGVPPGLAVAASVPLEKGNPDVQQQIRPKKDGFRPSFANMDVYRATLKEKTGELFVAVAAAPPAKKAVPPGK